MKRLTPYAQLIRLPNVFTALADIFMASLARGFAAINWFALPPLLLASACLYSAGMVWNDFFDIEQDRRERPFRPLPSGRITRSTAAWVGGGLMAAGLLFALVAGIRRGGLDGTPLVVAVLLVLAIFLYNGGLKRTWAGPLAMGTCRFLNVLLGLTAVEGSTGPMGVHVALAVGVYIAGVTWFARTEARTSSQAALALAAVVMLAGLVLAVLVPAWLEPGTSSPLFPYLLVGLAFLVGFPVVQAIRTPTPPRVQAAVIRAIRGLVVFDAVLATAFVGLPGLLLLVLLLPTLYLGRWVYST